MQSVIIFTVGFIVALVRSDDAPSVQEPKWLDALDILRGGKTLLSAEEQQDLLRNAVAGKDYPINAIVPAWSVNCASYKQAGFYADVSEPSNCQAFHYCDFDGKDFGFLCANGTLFNQITLVCDRFFNIDCSKSYQFIDYSNGRLYKEGAVLLDDQLVYPSGADGQYSQLKAAVQKSYKTTQASTAGYTLKTTASYGAKTTTYAVKSSPTTTAYTTKATTKPTYATKATTKPTYVTKTTKAYTTEPTTLAYTTEPEEETTTAAY
jgi:hypothetical protein